MRRPPHYLRILAVAATVTACLAATGAAALAGPPASRGQLSQSEHYRVGHLRQPCHLAAERLEERNTQVVLAALQIVFNEHRVDQVDRFFTADFINHSPLVSPDNASREGLKRWLTGIVTAIPDLTYIPGDPMADGDRVMVFADVQGTIEGDLPMYGIKGTGQRLEVGTAQVFRVVHGKIAEHWEVVDTGPLLRLALASPVS